MMGRRFNAMQNVTIMWSPLWGSLKIERGLPPMASVYWLRWIKQPMILARLSEQVMIHPLAPHCDLEGTGFGGSNRD